MFTSFNILITKSFLCNILLLSMFLSYTLGYSILFATGGLVIGLAANNPGLATLLCFVGSSAGFTHGLLLYTSNKILENSKLGLLVGTILSTSILHKNIKNFNAGIYDVTPIWGSTFTLVTTCLAYSFGKMVGSALSYIISV